MSLADIEGDEKIEVPSFTLQTLANLVGMIAADVFAVQYAIKTGEVTDREREKAWNACTCLRDIEIGLRQIVAGEKGERSE